MNRSFDLVLRQVQLVDGRVADVGIADGRFTAVAPKLSPTANDMDGSGKLLLSGLHDHHIHLLATAAHLESLDLSGLADADAIIGALRATTAETKNGKWIRAVGYDERVAGIPDRHLLDTWLPERPLRLQDRTGALWVLNSAALALVGKPPWPECVEVDVDSSLSGRIWRGDDWLRAQTGHQRPSLWGLSRQLARWGVTAVTDAGANNGQEEAAVLSGAIRCGELLQRLTMMGHEGLPQSGEYQRGPVKLLYDESALPELDSIAIRIKAARVQGRSVAAHCVTEAELLTYLAALEDAGGALLGDRVEHGSMIPQSFIADIADLRLTVVANPGFIARRGDRYLTEMGLAELQNLQRLRTLSDAGVTVLAGSDAPYGATNPWIAISAAMFRKTPSGAILGRDEAVSGGSALALFSGNVSISSGAPADCCLVDSLWQQHLIHDADPDPVHLTLIDGQIIYSRGR